MYFFKFWRGLPSVNCKQNNYARVANSGQTSIKREIFAIGSCSDDQVKQFWRLLCSAKISFAPSLLFFPVEFVVNRQPPPLMNSKLAKCVKKTFFRKVRFSGDFGYNNWCLTCLVSAHWRLDFWSEFHRLTTEKFEKVIVIFQQMCMRWNDHGQIWS